MKTRHSIFLTLIALFLGACSRNYYYPPATAQSENVDVMFTHGMPALHATVEGASVTADLTSFGNRNMTLNLFVQNKGENAFNFLPEQVRAYGLDAAGNRIDFQVFSADQFKRRVRNRNLLIAGAAVVATVATVVALSDSDSGSGDHNDDCYDNGLWWAWAATPTVIVTPPSSAVRPADGLLRQHTLYPEESLEGVVKMKANSAGLKSILVEVPVNGEYVSFVFDRHTRRF